MPPLVPSQTIEHVVPSFGKIKGLEFPGGVRQFCGIPYADISKRWTRSILKTSLSGMVHDGTQHGSICPQPPEYPDLIGGLVPVEPFPHFQTPEWDELNCLNLNIVMPPEYLSGPHPVMVWIHGGSFLMGASTHPAYDMTKFVSHAVKSGTPVVGVSVSYRVGLFGFLASQAIKDDLAADGYQGAGNFGLTDQQTALEWVQQYIPDFNGDPTNVTIFGESAGGMSVAHQIWAAQPAVFHRAISLSGNLNTIPTWSLERHESRWKALLKHLSIAPSAANALDQLRSVPQKALANATCVIEGTMGTTGNPCDDGWFHSATPSISSISSPPAWLRSYMVGDVLNEAIIFRQIIVNETYETLKATLLEFVQEPELDAVLAMYGIGPDISAEKLRLKFEDLATDACFTLQNRIHASVSKVPKTYAFHMDQLASFGFPLDGLAYHAIDVAYFFMNLTGRLTLPQQKLGEKMAEDLLNFAWGREPWKPYGQDRHWMVYGPDNKWAVKTEIEDELTRNYKRMDRILHMGGDFLDRWIQAVDHFANQRWLQKSI